MARRFDGLSTDHSTSASQGGNSLSLSESILDNIFEHKIDGEVFLSLNDENLREIAPLLGDRLKIKRLISETLVKLDTMLNEFCSLTGAEECKFKENWGKYEKLVFKYAPLEQKKSLKIFCISIMLRSVTMLVDRTAAYTLDLLWALLSTNRSSGQPLISIFEVCVIISCAHNNIPIHTGRWRGRVSQQHTNLPAVVQRAAYVLCIIM
ncbi:hypothetical protein GBAR_LOCUS17865 [Geodia barretti]|uniref:SAM domain-containing protein n=1 Tax=Geodia barretti TaxID=519541 RepID=A0AA35SK64_GEOBA|nr:hypothetical protein GBAR_LOCUS17865 [Geodia barretti]